MVIKTLVVNTLRFDGCHHCRPATGGMSLLAQLVTLRYNRSIVTVSWIRINNYKNIWNKDRAQIFVGSSVASNQQPLIVCRTLIFT